MISVKLALPAVVIGGLGYSLPAAVGGLAPFEPYIMSSWDGPIPVSVPSKMRSWYLSIRCSAAASSPLEMATGIWACRSCAASRAA